MYIYIYIYIYIHTPVHIYHNNNNNNISLGYTGVCEKDTPLDKKTDRQISFQKTSQGLDCSFFCWTACSFCCWTAGQGLAQKECFVHRHCQDLWVV